MDNRRWTKEECPYPIAPSRNARRRYYEQTHDKITKWDDLTKEDKELLIKVKQIITSYLGDRVIKIFGSRVNGNWIESSDWDVAVIGEIPNVETQLKIKTLDYGFLIDVQFHRKCEESDILIP